MYGRIYSSDIEKMKGLPKGSLLIYAVLINRGGSRREVTISQRELSSCSGLSLRLISKAITDLRRRQVIKVERRGKKLSNIYRLCDTNETFVSVESDTNETSVSPASDTNKTCKSDTNESFVSTNEENTIDNYNSITIGENEKSILSFLNCNWNWEISVSDYQHLRDEFGAINHRLELMSIDAWNRKLQSENRPIWPKKYALRSMRNWFMNLRKEDNPYRENFPKSLSRFVVPIGSSPSPPSSPSSPAAETKWIKQESPEHLDILRRCPSDLLDALDVLEIGQKDASRSVDLFWRYKPKLSPGSIQYLRRNQQYEMLYFYATIAGIE